MRLLELNDDVRALAASGALDMGHARALLAISGPRQSQVASEVVARGLSARDTEALVKRILSPATPGRSGNRAGDPDVQRRYERMSRHAIERWRGLIDFGQRRGLFRADVDPARRLVEQEQIHVGEEEARERDLLLVTAG